MRILSWLGVWPLVIAGCHLLAPLDELTGGPIEASGPDKAGSRDATPEERTDDGPAPQDEGAVGDAPLSDGPDGPDGPVGPACSPCPVRHVVGTLRGIAVTDEHFYWVEGSVATTGLGSWTAYRVSKPNADEAGAAEEIAQGTDLFDVAVSNGYAFFTDGPRVGRKALGDASAPAQYFSVGVGVTYLTVDTFGRAFASGPNLIAMGPCSPPTPCPTTGPASTGASSIILKQGDGAIGVSGVALHSNLLFWSHADGPGVNRAEVSTLPLAPREMDFEVPPEPVSGVAADETDVYWIAGNHLILATPITGAPMSPRKVCDDANEIDADAGFGSNADIAVDVDWVYFTEPNAGRIRKCSKR